MPVSLPADAVPATASETVEAPPRAAPPGWRDWLPRWPVFTPRPAPEPPPSPPSDDLATQVRDLELLHEATLRIARTRDWNTALREILRAALVALGTDKGLFSLATEDGTGLRIGVAEGFGDEFVQSIGFVARGTGACGAAFQRRARVLVRDADTDVLFIGLHDAVRLGRFKSVHSVPLLSRGEAIGVLSVHFLRRHESDAREMRLLDLYAQMASDFIERWRAEAALQSSERQLQQVLSSLPAGVYTCDREGRLTFFNQAAAEIWGRAPRLADEKWSGAHRVLLADGGEYPLEQWPIVRTLNTGRSVHGAEVIIERPDGSQRHILPYPEVLRDAAGQSTGVMNVLVDITDRVEALRERHACDTRFRQLLSVLPVGVFSIAAPGVFGFCNRRAMELWGAEPAAGLPLAEFHDQFRLFWSDGQPMRADDSPLRHALATGHAVADLELQLERADGTRIFLELDVDVMRDERGVVTDVLGVFSDVTARKQAERALRQSEIRLRAVTDVVPVMLMRCDLNECFEFANQAYLERRGLTLEQLLGRPIRSVVGEEAYARIKPYIERVLAGEETRYEISLGYGGLGERQVSVAYVPERDDAGVVRGWVGSVTDITEHRRIDAINRELAAIVASSNDAIVGTDLRGIITTWNRGAQRLFGYGASEVVGRPLAVLTPEDRAQEAQAILRAVYAGERIEHFLTRRLRRDGAEAQVSLTVSPILDDHGRIVGASAIARDVTELQLAQQALQERTRMLQAVNQVTGALVAELDLERIAQSVLQAGREVSGAALGAFFIAREVDGSAARLLGATGGAAALAEAISAPEFIAALRERGPLAAAGLLRRVDGRFASEFAVPVVSRSGELVGGLLFGDARSAAFGAAVTDILQGLAAVAALAFDNAKLYRALERELGEKRHAEAELRAAQAQLQAHATLLEQKVQERTQSLRDAIAQMEEFSYTVSHDLRAPLRAMNTYAQALVEDFGPQLDATARHYLERIQRSSLRMEKLTHDVLTYSRLARSEIKLGPVDLDGLLSDMIYQYAEFQPPHAEIKVKRPLHDVLGHEVSLGQCVANLLTNAVKFVAPGVQPRIRIHTEQEGATVRLWIADNGIGIDPQYQSRLFHVFERLHDRQHYEGTGIGLAIVRKAVDKMGGRCGVESDGSHGSRFWIELPVAPPEPQLSHEHVRTPAAR